MQSIGMMLTLCIAGDFFADHTCGVSIALRSAYFADMTLIEDLYLEGTGTGAVVGAYRGQESRV
jgi:hypothetical protein